MNFGVESLEKAVRLEVLAEAAAQKRGITTKTYVFCLEASIHPTGMHSTCSEANSLLVYCQTDKKTLAMPWPKIVLLREEPSFE